MSDRSTASIGSLGIASCQAKQDIKSTLLEEVNRLYG
jgi:hypothetical protein